MGEDGVSRGKQSRDMRGCVAWLRRVVYLGGACGRLAPRP